MAKRIDVSAIADEIAGRILGGVIDDRLRWLGDGRVRVEMARIFPPSSGYKRTVQRRRRRLREALIERLDEEGWAHLGTRTSDVAAITGDVSPCGALCVAAHESCTRRCIMQEDLGQGLIPKSGDSKCAVG